MNDLIVKKKKMEHEILTNFVNLHAHKAKLTNEKCVYLAKHNYAGNALDCKLTIYYESDIISSFDTSSTTIQFLLHQMQTYDIYKQIMVGLIFDESNVFAHVLQLKEDE